VLLAETDALMLGDGGNNYTLGPAVVGEFAREFRKLPRLPFAEVQGAVDPVRVRSLLTADGSYFYAVNRESYPVRIELELQGAGELRHGDERLAVRSGDPALQLELQPYELRVFVADPAVRVASVRTMAPRAEHDRVAQRIAWIERALAGSPATRPIGWEAQVLADTVAKAREALQRGWLWRARTAFETSTVLQVFRTLVCYPPDMATRMSAPADCELARARTQ
jgi:hypothetical protein